MGNERRQRRAISARRPRRPRRAAHSREALRPRAGGPCAARRVRAGGGARQARTGPGVWLLWHRQVLAGARAVQGVARSFRLREVRPVPAGHPLRDAGAGTTDPGAPAPLVVDLVPELEILIGPQPLVPDLPLREAEDRFLAILGRFLAVFARSDHPLDVFLGDLQLVDPATLKSLARAVPPPMSGPLLAIGPYRDNEV